MFTLTTTVTFRDRPIRDYKVLSQSSKSFVQLMLLPGSFFSLATRRTAITSKDYLLPKPEVAYIDSSDEKRRERALTVDDVNTNVTCFRSMRISDVEMSFVVVHPNLSSSQSISEKVGAWIRRLLWKHVTDMGTRQGLQISSTHPSLLNTTHAESGPLK